MPAGSREPVYGAVITFAKGVFKALGIRFDITGQEHVPATGGAVMAINHTGYLDFTFAGLAALPTRRLVRFMAKKEVFDHRISGPLMRGMKHIPVDREAGADSYRAAVQALRSGELVGVFPEATISQSFELKEFKNGAVRMAQESGTPIIPVVLWGSQRVWPKGQPRSLKRNNLPIRIIVGEPYHPTDTDPTVATQDLKARMQLLLEQARATYPVAPEPGAWWVPAAQGGSAPTLEDAERADAEVRAARAARRAR